MFCYNLFNICTKLYDISGNFTSFIAFYYWNCICLMCILGTQVQIQDNHTIYYIILYFLEWQQAMNRRDPRISALLHPTTENRDKPTCAASIKLIIAQHFTITNQLAARIRFILGFQSPVSACHATPILCTVFYIIYDKQSHGERVFYRPRGCYMMLIHVH